MTLRQGDQIPEATFIVMGNDGPEAKSTDEIFGGKSVALFGVPGAYTPVCHKEHLPGILALHDTFKESGIDTIACTAVNDIFVLEQWSNELGAQGKIVMLADGNADFAVKSGVALDLRRYGLGIRSNRYAMLLADQTVNLISVEEAFTDHKVSSAAALNSQVGEVGRSAPSATA